MKNLFSKTKGKGLEIYTIILIVILVFWLSHFLGSLGFHGVDSKYGVRQ